MFCPLEFGRKNTKLKFKKITVTDHGSRQAIYHRVLRQAIYHRVLRQAIYHWVLRQAFYRIAAIDAWELDTLELTALDQIGVDALNAVQETTFSETAGRRRRPAKHLTC